MFTLVPAYGRDYKSAKEVKAAWENGQDFQINNMFSPNDGSYVNKADAPKGARITIRYKKLTQLVFIQN